MEFFHPLGVVVPPIQGWHVRVKVLRAYRVLLDHGSKRLGYVFADEQGLKIEGFVDRTMAKYYDGFIEEGKWYTITTFGLYNNLDEFRATKHHFKMYFLQGTVVQPTPSPDALIPNNFADFKKIMDDKIDATYLIDLVGAIFDVGTLENSATNGTDIDGFKLSFKIKDSNERVLSCNALANEALNFDRNYRMHGGGVIVLVLRWWRIYRYWDGPSNVKICTHGPISKVSINENIPETIAVREMLEKDCTRKYDRRMKTYASVMS